MPWTSISASIAAMCVSARSTCSRPAAATWRCVAAASAAADARSSRSRCSGALAAVACEKQNAVLQQDNFHGSVWQCYGLAGAAIALWRRQRSLRGNNVVVESA